jgi:glycosyltransferase involved in cell wall biosynthesis
MTIAVDCRMIDSSGVGVYLRGILPWFLQTENNFLLLGNADQLQPFTSNKNITIISCDIKPFSIRELFFFPLKTLCQINKARLFFSPFFNVLPVSVPVLTTIHDIIFPDMPRLMSKAGLAARMWFFRKAYKKSLKIFTVSEFSKSRIEHHLGMEKQVIVTHSAIRPVFLEYRAKTRGIQKERNIVFVGNIKKHKGLDCLLDAFHLARNEGLPHRLIIIGTKENFRTADNAILRKIEAIGNNAIFFTGFVSDEELMKYLSTAALLVQPSLYEGFCLPPLEAMVLGTHALISDIPVLKEVYDDYPVTFFHAGDSTDLKEKLLELLSKETVHTVCLSEDLVQKYTFEKTASVILRNLAVTLQ